MNSHVDLLSVQKITYYGKNLSSNILVRIKIRTRTNINVIVYK